MADGFDLQVHIWRETNGTVCVNRSYGVALSQMIQQPCRKVFTLPTDQFAAGTSQDQGYPALPLFYAEQMTLMTAWRFSTLTALRPRSSAGITSPGSVTFSP